LGAAVRLGQGPDLFNRLQELRSSLLGQDSSQEIPEATDVVPERRVRVWVRIGHGCLRRRVTLTQPRSSS
jgi:hypothetical protein